MLELRGVRIAHDDVEVVHGVDLDIARGETVGLIGPNGAGKSSLLRAICGLIRPSGGQMRFEGRDLTAIAPERIARLGLALVPEGRRIFGTLTVTENLALGARGGGGEGDRLESALERFPVLRRRAGQRADRLSGGEQQQLAIARALAGEPRLLILDEPSHGLAPKAIDLVYELLAGLAGKGVSMLLAEQSAARPLAFCERCVVLSDGRVRGRGTGEELRRDREVLHAYLSGQP